MQGRGDRPFFECSAQPIVSLPTNELSLRGFLAFWVDSATFQNRFFRNETIFPLTYRPARGPFGRRNYHSAGPGEIRRRECRHVRGAVARGRSLHPSVAQRRSLEEIPQDLPRAARF